MNKKSNDSLYYKHSKHGLFNISPILLFILVIGSILLPQTSALTVGISPPQVVGEHLLPGSEFEKVVMLSKDANEEMEMSIEIVDGPIRSWISTEPAEKFTLNNEGHTPFRVQVIVPKNTPPGKYKGDINLYIDQGGINGGMTGSSLKIRVPIKVMLEVTGQEKKEYAIKLLRIPPLNEGDNPTLQFTLENTGNIPARPESIGIIVSDKFKQQTIREFTLKIKEETKAFYEKPYTILLPIRLSSDQYWAHVTFYDAISSSGVVHEEDAIFDVLRNGKLAGEPGELPSSSTKPARYWPVAASILLFIIFLGYYLLSRAKKKKW